MLRANALDTGARLPIPEDHAARITEVVTETIALNAVENRSSRGGPPPDAEEEDDSPPPAQPSNPNSDLLLKQGARNGAITLFSLAFLTWLLQPT